MIQVLFLYVSVTGTGFAPSKWLNDFEPSAYTVYCPPMFRSIGGGDSIAKTCTERIGIRAVSLVILVILVHSGYRVDPSAADPEFF